MEADICWESYANVTEMMVRPWSNISLTCKKTVDGGPKQLCNGSLTPYPITLSTMKEERQVEISELHIKISDQDASTDRGRRVAELTVVFSDGSLRSVRTFPPNKPMTSDDLLEEVQRFVEQLKPESS